MSDHYGDDWIDITALGDTHEIQMRHDRDLPAKLRSMGLR